MQGKRQKEKVSRLSLLYSDVTLSTWHSMSAAYLTLTSDDCNREQKDFALAATRWHPPPSWLLSFWQVSWGPLVVWVNRLPLTDSVKRPAVKHGPQHSFPCRPLSAVWRSSSPSIATCVFTPRGHMSAGNMGTIEWVCMGALCLHGNVGEVKLSSSRRAREEGRHLRSFTYGRWRWQNICRGQQGWYV